ncbi:D-alanyl-D-alanine carboxypeptidase/D-alanyl-D-alanine-endopeptidase [Niastella yeongjuensis]|uniref:D-alanyl-D-alanine carboxypeptidase/D-alanyl-D-alanine-endopeptidase n=1 Tax=Niastella yeongjuensis TaxID=354355 RepID=A0A1V9EAG5_9BACT|nr:D-alanyl-D-alanine carboxypeptidase/D-alanyl-D-alanine-endopeptidase [Niastella yeongjuensis]OQP43082.1 D-alanyl-D-alanine carboxypeptidase/D-alanyl-D-alanine-endopeptidase [Niastella yeongjuensis]SEO65691.1 D-alanyl-D-alanine carboxypeptidase / D-alanyl-D-alanine-endopeptidase (penicillin-binding protein 4) [Niastella yeongjuensis]
MKKLLLLVFITTFVSIGKTQTITAKLANAVNVFEADAQMKHGIISLYVTDATTGKPVYEHNAQLGLAAASTQKLFTSAASFELLGSTYRYKTVLGYDGTIENGVLNGNLHVNGNGDPTLGSWRWKDTKEEVVCRKIAQALQQNNITTIKGSVLLNDSAFSMQPIPGGWIWDDIGNYYGAGCWAINWRENQFDLQLQPGLNEGDPARIVKTIPQLQGAVLNNQITTGKKGSGDNGYIYLAPYSTSGFTEGTVPGGNEPFVISGAFPNAPLQFYHALLALFTKQNISVTGSYKTYAQSRLNKESWPVMQQELITLLSPAIDSINYWFLRKSINLYGEVLIKTMAREKKGLGSTEDGVELVRTFWSEHGIDKSAVHMIDGSGLSPQNRVTTHAEVKVLEYAKTRSWYPAFYDALPEYNGMKMKSGSIGGARAFAGYHTANDGKQYVFSIIVNNYDGSPVEIVKKMYTVLNVLK